MTVTKHEILTVTTQQDARSIREAIDEIPSSARFEDAEIDRDYEPWRKPTVTLTFRLEVTE